MKKYLCIKNYGRTYLKGNYYEFYIDIFPSEYNFISVKEIRKQKLEKLNEKISLY